MARPGLTQHRKFLRLARILGSAPLALGCLEFMWERCYQNGDPYLGDEIDVEAACQWTGDAGKVTRALLDAGGSGNAGFIEEVPGRPGHFQCHDLFDHCPKYVGTRLAREMARIQKGQTLSQIRSEAGKKGARVSNRSANERSVADHDPASDQQKCPTPAPAPAPAPAPLGEVSPNTPLAPACAGAGGDSGPAAPKAKTPRRPSWTQAHPPEVSAAAKRICASWPRGENQPNSETPVPGISAPLVAERLAEIRKGGGSLDVCEAIAARMVQEFRSGSTWIKAPQHFFGKLGPWKAYYQAFVTNQQGGGSEPDQVPA